MIFCRFAILMTTLSSALLILPSFNLLTILRLQRGMLREVKTHATYTTLLISLNHFLLNGIFVAGSLYFRFLPTVPTSPALLITEFIVYRVAIPLNSAINPLIYLTRSTPMREFVCSGLTLKKERGLKLVRSGTERVRQVTGRMRRGNGSSFQDAIV